MAETPKKPGENNERDQSDTRDRSRLHAVADQAAEVARQVGGATRRTNEASADATRRAADQGREATMSGLRAIAGAQDAGFEQSRRVVEATARITDVYREASERAAGDVHALFESWTSLGRGLQRWQQAYFDHLEQWVRSVAGKRQDLVRSNSPVALAEVQRDLYVDLVGKTLSASTTLLQVSGQIAHDAVRPLQDRAQARAT